MDVNLLSGCYFFLGPLLAIGGLGAALLVLLPPFLDISTPLAVWLWCFAVGRCVGRLRRLLLYSRSRRLLLRSLNFNVRRRSWSYWT
jgi:hypothetical protein